MRSGSTGASAWPTWAEGSSESRRISDTVPTSLATGVGVRPYALAGLGVLRSKVDAFGDIPSLDNSELTWDFGGGVMFFFGTHVGLRADVRYFRTFSEVDFDPIDRPQTLEFGRGSAGLILRF